MTLETPLSAFSSDICRPPLLAPAARDLAVRAADLAQHVLTEPADATGDMGATAVADGDASAVRPDMRVVSDDIALWLGVLSGDVAAAEHTPGFRARGAVHAACRVPLEEALLLQHACVDVITRALTARLVRVSPRAGRAGVGRLVDALALAALRPATAAFAAGYRDAARATAGATTRAAEYPGAPDRRPFAWCLATGPGGRAEESSLRRFRAANPQALITTTGPGNAANGSFTAFGHDRPAVPDDFVPYGLVPVENGDTTRAARRAAIAAVLARHYGLGHLDEQQARPLLAALDLTPEEREAFLTSCLGPLLASSRNRHLVETLEAYLAHNLCTTAAARSLYVHRHTFAYRMRSVRALTGLDPDRPYHRLRAELALLMHRMHGSSAVPQQRTAAA